MAPTNAKANYKSYEAQARMVRAIVAAHPEVKWNYKEIAACYGSDMSEHALNHRFRRLRAQAAIIRVGREKKFDIKHLTVEENVLPTTQDAVKKEEDIAKYFGQSTTDGIQFQFRTIKKDADRLRDVADSGGDVANCLELGGGSSVMSTPSKPTPFTTPTSARRRGGRGGARGGARGTGGSTRGKRKTADTFIKRSSSDEEGQEDDDEDDEDAKNWSEMDESPSKRAKTGALPGQKNGIPSRQAAVKAVATIADATAELQDSEPLSDTEPTPKTARNAAQLPKTTTTTQSTQSTQVIPSTTVAPSSIFGDVYAPPSSAIPYTSMAEDAFFGRDYDGGDYGGSVFENFGEDDEDGFI